jgi:hypothetical protein
LIKKSKKCILPVTWYFLVVTWCIIHVTWCIKNSHGVSWIKRRMPFDVLLAVFNSFFFFEFRLLDFWDLNSF